MGVLQTLAPWLVLLVLAAGVVYAWLGSRSEARDRAARRAWEEKTSGELSRIYHAVEFLELDTSALAAAAQYLELLRSVVAGDAGAGIDGCLAELRAALEKNGWAPSEDAGEEAEKIAIPGVQKEETRVPGWAGGGARVPARKLQGQIRLDLLRKVFLDLDVDSKALDGLTRLQLDGILLLTAAIGTGIERELRDGMGYAEAVPVAEKLLAYRNGLLKHFQKRWVMDETGPRQVVVAGLTAGEIPRSVEIRGIAVPHLCVALPPLEVREVRGPAFLEWYERDAVETLHLLDVTDEDLAGFRELTRSLLARWREVGSGAPGVDEEAQEAVLVAWARALLDLRYRYLWIRNATGSLTPAAFEDWEPCLEACRTALRAAGLRIPEPGEVDWGALGVDPIWAASAWIVPGSAVEKGLEGRWLRPPVLPDGDDEVRATVDVRLARPATPDSGWQSVHLDLVWALPGLTPTLVRLAARVWRGISEVDRAVAEASELRDREIQNRIADSYWSPWYALLHEGLGALDGEERRRVRGELLREMDLLLSSYGLALVPEGQVIEEQHTRPTTADDPCPGRPPLVDSTSREVVMAGTRE